MASYASSPENYTAGLTLASAVGRSAGKSPYSGRWAVAATAAKVSRHGMSRGAAHSTRRAPLTIRASFFELLPDQRLNLALSRCEVLFRHVAHELKPCAT